MSRLAYACRWKETLCYVAAETSGKAKAVVNHSLEEYLGEFGEWNNIRCQRAPQYDTWAANARGTETMSPAYMPPPEPARV